MAERKVSLSIGVAPLRAAVDLPLKTLVCYADEALYRVKRQGRNQVEIQPVWQPGIAREELRDAALEFEQAVGRV